MARARPAGRYHRAADPTVLEQIWASRRGNAVQEQDERASSPGNERRSPHHYLSGQAGGVAHRALRKRPRGLCFGAQSEGSQEAGRGGGGSQGRPRASLGSLYRRQSIATPSPMTSARSPNRAPPRVKRLKRVGTPLYQLRSGGDYLVL